MVIKLNILTYFSSFILYKNKNLCTLSNFLALLLRIESSVTPFHAPATYIWYIIMFLFCYDPASVSQLNFLPYVVRSLYINKAKSYMSFIYHKCNLELHEKIIILHFSCNSNYDVTPTFSHVTAYAINESSYPGIISSLVAWLFVVEISPFLKSYYMQFSEHFCTLIPDLYSVFKKYFSVWIGIFFD